MGELHQHPDGYVYVRTAGKTYGDTKANFELDAGLTLSALPAGADERVYAQDKRHASMGGGNIVDGGPMPWPLGDLAIANISALLTAQAARIAAAAAVKAAEQAAAAALIINPVTALQARRAMRAAGLYAQVLAAVNASPDPDVKDSWEYATIWHRDARWIAALGTSLNLTSAQIDALFRQALKL